MVATFAILTPTPVEWAAMCKRLGDAKDAEDQTLPAKVGRIGSHTVVCVQSGKGEANTAAALQDILNKWSPRWVLLAGVAGGFTDLQVKRGDVLIASFVYYVEFGKLGQGRYTRRPEYDYPPDRSLLAHAETLAEVGDKSWVDQIGVPRPDSQPAAATRVHVGYIASGDKVIDDPDHELFRIARATIPEVHAVEMEASGAGASVHLEQSRRAVGFLMIRGISDEPTPPSVSGAVPGSEQRKFWKEYAAGAAAAFVQAFLSGFRGYTGQPREAVTVWNVPHPRNPFFTGRDTDLTSVRAALASKRIVALTGLGGIGKTQTAIEYAYRYRDEYKAVLWVDASSREALVLGFLSVASSLNLPSEHLQDHTIAVEAAKRWLASSADWLLILNNANDLMIVREFIPTSLKGHILLTTQAQSTGPIATAIEVRSMNPDAGALFLLRRAKLLATDRILADADDAEIAVAKKIAVVMGGLPLALDQAGAFIEETRSMLAEYLNLYRSEGTRLRAERGSFGVDHPESVTITFSLTFAKTTAANLAAADLIRLCAFLHADMVPEEILTEGVADLSEALSAAVATPLSLANVMKEACRYSLVSRDPNRNTLSIHRVVQSVIKDGMDTSTKRLWAQRAVRAVNRTLPHVDVSTWDRCERLLAHVQVCAELIKEWDFEFHEVTTLLSWAGNYLCDRALYGDSEPFYTLDLAMSEKTLGPDHREVAESLSNLAGLYRVQGKYAEAERFYQRALAILEKVLGRDHLKVARSLNALAWLYRLQGKYPEAEPLCTRALAISEKALGPGDLGVAPILDNLALLYHAQGRYAEAESLCKRTLTITENARGLDHPDVAVSLNNLAMVYRALEKYADAETLYRRALAIFERVLGPDHPEVGASLNNLAGLYRVQGKYAEAERFYQRALAIREKVLGSDHIEVAQVLGNLAVLYFDQDMYQEAEPLCQRALKIREEALGPDHPEVAQALYTLALLKHGRREYDEAELLYQRAIPILKNTLGPNHPNLAKALVSYAVLLRETNRDAEALRIKGQADAILAKHGQKAPTQ